VAKRKRRWCETDTDEHITERRELLLGLALSTPLNNHFGLTQPGARELETTHSFPLTASETGMAGALSDG